MLTWTRRRLRAASTGDDGNLFVVMLFTIVLIGLVIALTITVISSTKKTRFSEDFAVGRDGVDAATAAAVNYLNSGGNVGTPGPDGLTQVRSGVVRLAGTTDRSMSERRTCWEWQAKRVNEYDPVGVENPVIASGAPTAYDIYTRAWAGNKDACDPANRPPGPMRQAVTRVAAVMTGTGTASVNPQSGQVQYQVTPALTTRYALFTSGSMTLQGTSVVSTGADRAYVGSGGNVDAGASISGGVDLFNSATRPFTDRCLGAGCSNVNLKDEAIGGSTFTTGSWPAWQDPSGTSGWGSCSGGSTTTDWWSSINGPTLNGTCLTGTLVVDRPTTISGSVRVGRVVMMPGGSLTASGSPSGGRLYVTGNMVALQGSVSGLIYAPNAYCIGSNGGTFTGSLACQRIYLNSWTVRWDQSLIGDGTDPFGSRRVQVWTSLENREVPVDTSG